MADLNRKMAEGHTVSDLDTVIDEVYGAHGDYDTLGDRLDDIDTIIDTAKLGIHYKGEVNYYSNLPTTGVSIGDAYTVKYAGSSGTTPDGTEYVWGTVSGTNQWINFSKDSYTKAEVDALLALKQNALSSTQLDAVNSGIDSTKVSQIETNKNNIVFVSQNGAANYAKVGTNSYANNGLTVTVSNGEITISGTANASFSLYIGGTISDDNTSDVNLKSKLPDFIAFTGAPNTDNKNRMIFALYNGSTWVYSGSTNNLYHDLTDKVYTHWLLYIPIVSGNQYNGVWKPMIVPKTLYDSGFTNYQPYAMSNTELTAKEQQNENNISSANAELIELVDSGAKNKIFVDKLNTTNANGVTYTINSDGTITVNGTPSGSSPSYAVVAMPDGSTYKNFAEFCNGDYILSGCPTGGSINTYRMYITGTGYTREDFGNGVKLTDTSVSPLYLIIYIYNGYTVTNLTFKPMICSKSAWDVSQKYVPYAMSNAELTAAIQALQAQLANQ